LVGASPLFLSANTSEEAIAVIATAAMTRALTHAVFIACSYSAIEADGLLAFSSKKA
jgi:hypothetical protein